MATTTFGIGALLICGFGANRGTVSTMSNAWALQGNGSSWEGTFTGTAFSIPTYLATSNTAVTVSIDGGAYTAVTWGTTGSVASNQTIVSGLTDTTHTISIRVNSGANVLNIPALGSWSVTGAAPAMGFQTNLQAQYICAANSTFIVAEGKTLVSASTSGYTNMLKCQSSTGGAGGYNGGSVRFRAQISSLTVFGGQFGDKWTLNIDGIDQSLVTSVNASTFGMTVIATGLDNTAYHTYTLYLCGATTSSTATNIFSLITSGVGIDLTTGPAARTKKLLAYGDSIIVGYTGTGVNDSGLDGRLIAVSKNWEFINRGYSGSTAYTFGSGTAPYTSYSGASSTRLAELTNSSITGDTPDFVLFAIGTNDLSQRGPTLPETVAQYQAAVYTELSYLTTNFPSARIVVRYILPAASFSPNTLATWNAALYAAGQASGSGNGDGAGNYLSSAAAGRLIYIDSSGGSATSPGAITSTQFLQNNGASVSFSDPNSQTVDGLHPTAAAYAVIAANEIAAFNTSAPTLSSVAASVDGLSISVVLATGASPIQGTNTTAWSPVANGTTANPVTSVIWTGNAGKLVLTNPVRQTDTYTIAYNSAVGNVTDSTPGTPLALATFSAQAVTNNSVLGTITAAPTVVPVGFTESAGTMTVTYGVTLPAHGVGIAATSNGTTVTLGGNATNPTYTTTYNASNPPPALLFYATNAISNGPSVSVPLFAGSGVGAFGAISIGV